MYDKGDLDMKTLVKLATAGTLLLFSSGFTLAECVDADSTASTSAEVKTPPVAKDGSQAPLEAEPRADAQESDAGPAQKDGGTMPLASDEADDTNDVATSQQDVEAQQEGEQTAAAKTDAGC